MRTMLCFINDVIFMPVFKIRQIINSKSQPHSLPSVKFWVLDCSNCVKMHILLATICDCLHAVPRRNDEATACRDMRRYTAG